MPVIELTIDAGGAVTGLKQFDQASDRSAKSMGSLRAGLNDVGQSLLNAGKIAGAVAVGFAAFSIKAASDLEETQGKFDVVFGKFDENFEGLIQQSEAWASNLNENYGLSEEASKRYLSSIQDLIVPTGLARDVSAELSNEFVKLAVDIASFNNKANKDVVADFQSALAGSAETMVKYGIDVRKTAVEQEALRLGLIKAGEELTRQASVQAIYSIALRESSDAVGDFERTSDSFANQTKVFQKILQDFSATVGKELLPYATQAVTAFNDWAAVEGNLEGVIQGGIVVVKGLANALGGVILYVEGFTYASLFLAENLTKLLAPLEYVIEGLKAIGVIEIDTNPITALRNGITDLKDDVGDALESTWDKVETTNRFFDDMAGKFDEVGAAAEESSKKQIEAQEKVQDAVSKTKDMLNQPGSMGEVSPKAFTDLAELERRLGAVQDETGELATTWKNVDGVWTEVLTNGKAVTDGMVVKLDELTNATLLSKSAVEQVDGVWKQTAESLKAATEPAVDGVAALKSEITGAGSEALIFAENMGKLGELSGIADSLKAEIKGIQEEFKAGLVTQEQYQSKFAELTTSEIALDRVKGKISELTEEMKKASEEVDNFSRADSEIASVEKSLGGVSTNAKLANKSLEGLASALLSQQELEGKISVLNEELDSVGGNAELAKQKLQEIAVAEVALSSVNERVDELRGNLERAGEVEPFGHLKTEADTLVKAVKGAGKEIGGLGKQFDDLSKKTLLKEKLESELENLRSELDKVGSNAELAAEKISDIAATEVAIGTLTDEISSLKEEIKGVAEAAEGPTQEITEMVAKLKDGFDSASGSASEMNKKIGELAELRQVAGVLESEVEQLRKEFDTGKVSVEQYNSKLQELVRAEAVLDGVKEKISDITDELKGATAAAGEMEKALDDRGRKEGESGSGKNGKTREFSWSVPNLSTASGVQQQVNIIDTIQSWLTSAGGVFTDNVKSDKKLEELLERMVRLQEKVVQTAGQQPTEPEINVIANISADVLGGTVATGRITDKLEREALRA